MATKGTTGGPLVLASVDPYNPASVAMLARAFFLHPMQTGIRCILKTSLADFSIRPNGNEYAMDGHVVGRERPRPLLKETPPWTGIAPNDTKPRLKLDEDYENPEVREDTVLATQATALAITSILAEAIHDCQDCTFYTHKESIGNTYLNEGYAHIAHGFTWGFNNDERAEYWGLVQAPTTGDVLRIQICQLCQWYIQRISDELGIESLDDILFDIKELDDDLGKDHSCIFALADAPLSEALPYVKMLHNAHTFIRYGNIDPDTKALIDTEMLDDSKDESVKRYRIIVDGVKNASLELTKDELNDLFDQSPQLRDYFCRHKRDAHDEGCYGVHELMTSVLAERVGEREEFQPAVPKTYVIMDPDELLALMSKEGEAGPSSVYCPLSQDEIWEMRHDVLQAMKVSPKDLLAWW
ncbi:hypothetical protein F4604DRAFT_1918589 [Suillus subluteus]|nr:hypothetical protein F4604DRAFT_1918589 [Suillus subluteus]